MAKFNIADKVLNVNTNEKGVILSVHSPVRGRQLYRVKYGDGEKDSLESNLIVDTDLTDPFECCKQGLFGTYHDFSRINTTFKIQNTSNNTISTLKASKTIFKAYQFKPLLKFLNSGNRRLLIADEVGLGKTIEAGHIMMELSARKEFRNILIVCPKMLQEKWKTELREKFNFTFKIYDRKSDLVDDLNSGNLKAIVNYEAIRSSKKKDDETNPILKHIEEKNVRLDFILCDEAHRLRNKETKTYKGAEIIIQNAISAVFLTATPIMISEENLYNLLHLLDNQQFNNSEIFQNYLSINKPFIVAISQLNSNVPLAEIATTIRGSELSIRFGEDLTYQRNTTIDQLFKDYPLYNKIIEDLTSGKDTIEKRVALQFDISSMSMMNNIFSRTRKREVTTDWTQPIREPHTIKVELYNDEREHFDRILDEYIDEHSYIDEYGDAKLTQGHSLGLIQKKRRIASSIYGFLNSEEDLNNGVDRYAALSDAKFESLIKLLKKLHINTDKKIIIFALFRNTLKYLSIRLANMGYSTVMIHGDIKERDNVINEFKTNANINVLLSSEVGSEGLDMQFCDIICNYDLPWNPMVIEQRIGRIDRFGQKSSRVHIYNLIVKNSIQEEIYDRLLDRIGIFKSCIGDLEAILDKDTESGTLQQRIVKLEKDLYCNELTPEERKVKIENISRAILIEKTNLEQINEGLTDTLTNDLYFRNEIDKVQRNHRYITDIELQNYLQSIIRNHLTQCVLQINLNKTYTIKIPHSDNKYLINFLSQHQPSSSDVETEVLFRQFINSIRDKVEFEFTMNQETAYNNPRTIYVNAYHPLILASKEFFQLKLQDIKTAFQFGINIKHFKDVNEITVGDYFLGIYTFSITKKWFGKHQIVETLVPVVFDMQTNSIIENSDICERILGESQLNATIFNNAILNIVDIVDDIRTEFAVRINDLFTNYIEDQKMRLENGKKLQIQQTEEFYNNRISIQVKEIADIENKANYSWDEEERNNSKRILPARKGKLSNLIAEKDETIYKMKDSSIQPKEPKLISLSHIKIF
ncbi:MAG: hypothetical protein EOM44_10165 [Bacteroidia bacterium]|nr:hypothetical protein [Bacteroidia bacterium]